MFLPRIRKVCSAKGELLYKVVRVKRVKYTMKEGNFTLGGEYNAIYI